MDVVPWVSPVPRWVLFLLGCWFLLTGVVEGVRLRCGFAQVQGLVVKGFFRSSWDWGKLDGPFHAGHSPLALVKISLVKYYKKLPLL